MDVFVLHCILFLGLIQVSVAPIGKISSTAGKGVDYSAGNVNVQHLTQQSGGKAESGYQKSSVAHSYGAGAININDSAETPKVNDNLGYSRTSAAKSDYGMGSLGVAPAVNAPKLKHDGLGQVDHKNIDKSHE